MIAANGDARTNSLENTMSETAKTARASMKAKAKRLASTDPQTKVDSSTWSPSEPLNTDVKTGMRPLSRRAYKKGGKVVGKADGEKAEFRADRNSRSKRYLTPDNLINRDQKMANEVREGGMAHVGGLKHGGKAKKFGGGPIGENPINQQNQMMGRAAGAMKKGGKVHKANGGMRSEGTEYAKSKSKMEDSHEKSIAATHGEFNPFASKRVSPKEGMMARKQFASDLKNYDQTASETGYKKGGRTKRAGGGRDRDTSMYTPEYFKGKHYDIFRGMQNAETEAPAAAPVAAKKAIVSAKSKPQPSPMRDPMMDLSAKRMSRDEDVGAVRDIIRKEQVRKDQEANPSDMVGVMAQKRGGKVKFEGSAKDQAQDKKLAAKRGMTMKQWEASKADDKHDSQESMKGLKKGGAASGRTMKYGGGGVFSGNSTTKIPGVVGGREAHAKGGRTKSKGKGKTHINIIIGAHGAPAGGGMMPNAPVPAPMSPRTPPMPEGGPPMPPMPPPGMMPPSAGGPPMPPPGMMPRKNGGRTIHVIDHAAGGGLGRKEKIKAYGGN